MRIVRVPKSEGMSWSHDNQSLSLMEGLGYFTRGQGRAPPGMATASWASTRLVISASLRVWPTASLCLIESRTCTNTLHRSAPSVLGFPLGLSSLTYLSVSLFATYIKNVLQDSINKNKV